MEENTNKVENAKKEESANKEENSNVKENVNKNEKKNHHEIMDLKALHDKIDSHILQRDKRFLLLLVFCGILSVGLVVSIVLSVISFRQNQQITKLIREDVIGETSETQEDDVRIANEYFIRSTKNISDAYISGNTSSLNDKDKETLDMASAVLDEIITDGMSDFDKEKAVYDWMVHNLQNDSGILTVIPTTQADCDNPYGVLKYHNAVCVGYATTFRLFMQMMEIPCMVVHNTEQYHSWDLVKLNGHWYHTDVYSDVGTDNYRNFNMNDTMCMQSQEWDVDYFPAADSLEYNMSYRNAQQGVDIYQLPSIVRDMLDQGQGMSSYIYGKDFTEDQAVIASQLLSDCNDKIQNSEEYGNYYLDYNFSKVDEGYLLTIYVNCNVEDQAEESISDENRDKIDQAVENAFGDLTNQEEEGTDDLDGLNLDDLNSAEQDIE